MKCFDEFGDPCMPERLQGCHFNVSGGASQYASNPVTNPEVFSLLKQNVAGAQNIAAQPFQSYGQPMSAGLSPLQHGTSSLLSGPARTAGMDTMSAGAAGASNLMSFKPSNVSAGPGTNSITAGSLPGTDLSGYMNPFQKQVTDTTMADLERQRQIQRVADNQGATAAGGGSAFGGSRAGVADSLTNDAYFRNAGSTLAGLNLGNFNNAQGMATSDLNRALAAATSNQGAQANDLNRALSAGQSNQNAGIAGANVNQNAAATAGQIGQAQGQQFLNVTNAMAQQGNTEQTTQQNALTQAYQEFLRQQNNPLVMQQLVSQAMGLVPGAIGQSSKSSSFNFGAGIA